MLQQYDPKNAHIFVWINDKLVPRDEACISVFDSAVQGGDAVWEGMRVYHGKVFCIEEHLDRLMASAHALMFAAIPEKEFIRNAIYRTLEANKMEHDAHIRLTLTRGEKVTSGMDPRLNTKGCTLIILAEWKKPVYGVEGITLISSSQRRNNPQFLDSKIHHNNLLNNILAKIEANVAGADDALMLDQNGFVAETNACNIFMIKNGMVMTPHADACLPGITRNKIIAMCAQHHIAIHLKNISLTEMYTADEVFTSGSMGELVPVKQIDGRQIVNRSGKSVFDEIQTLFRRLTESF
ncbi:MAG: aminotransferase class IV [Chitinophagales bacterium]